MDVKKSRMILKQIKITFFSSKGNMKPYFDTQQHILEKYFFSLYGLKVVRRGPNNLSKKVT